MQQPYGIKLPTISKENSQISLKNNSIIGNNGRYRSHDRDLSTGQNKSVLAMAGKDSINNLNQLIK